MLEGLEALKAEVLELKSLKVKLSLEVETLDREKLLILDKIAKFRKSQEESSRKLESTERQLKEVASTLQSNLQKLEVKNDEASKILDNALKEQYKADLALKMLDKEKVEMISQTKTNKERAVFLTGEKFNLERLKEGLEAQEKELDARELTLNRELSQISLKRNEATSQLESAKELKRTLDLREAILKEKEKDFEATKQDVQAKSNFLEKKYEMLEEVKKDIARQLNEAESLKKKNQQEEAYYVARINEFDARESKLKLLELRVQKLIKDKDLKNEIKALEKSISG